VNSATLARFAIGLLGLALFGIAWPNLVNPYWVGVATTLLMWIALTESWILLSGMTGYISLGHAFFVGLGAYVLVLTWREVPLWLGLSLAGLSAGAAAFVIGIPCLRVRGPYFVILTLGVAEFGKYVVVNIEAKLGKFGRLLLGAPPLEDIFRMMLVLAAVAFCVAYAVRRSRFGAGLRALREDEEASQTAGVPVVRLKVLAFVASAIIPGIAGCLLVMRGGYFEPLQVFNPLISLTIITMSTIGGSDDAPGPLLGAMFLVILSELLWSNAPQLYMVILGALLIGFVLNMPDGIYARLRPHFRPRAT
jgi:branched-chain amino acid transport system permease protein